MTRAATRVFLLTAALALTAGADHGAGGRRGRAVIFTARIDAK
jgi:hypothetical protein